MVCVNYSDHVTDQSECDPDYVPETSQDCSMSPCPQWTPDSGLDQYPFQNEGYHPRSPNPSHTHVLVGNQWRTGPWGAVSIPGGPSVIALLSQLRPRAKGSQLEAALEHEFSHEMDVHFPLSWVNHSGPIAVPEKVSHDAVCMRL